MSSTRYQVLANYEGQGKRKDSREGEQASGIMLARLPGKDLPCTHTERCERKSAGLAACQKKNSLHSAVLLKSKMSKPTEKQAIQPSGSGLSRQVPGTATEAERGMWYVWSKVGV